MPPMKIAIVSKSNSSGGGASRVAEQLALRLGQREGIVAHHWMAYPAGRMKHARRLYGAAPTRVFQKTCRSISSLIGLPDFLTPEMLYFAWRQRKVRYDVVHFHDITRAVSPVGMRWLARHMPVVWTFHDCSPFTGGCINPMGCTAYESRCGNCPRLGLWPLNTRLDCTGFMQAYKRRTARLGLFTPVAPSTWIASESVKAGFFDEPPMVIANAVDTDCFRPLDRSAIHRILGLDPNLFTILIAAGHLGDPFKGTQYAVQAINRLDRPVQVLFVGLPDENLISACRAKRKHVIGSIGHERFLAQYFAAADVYLYPTVADNLPNTVLETMACGTPTIGFRTGGMADMIEHAKNGYLVEQGDADGLVAGLKTADEHPAVLRAWSATAETRATTVFGYARFIDDHLRLYERVAGRTPDAPSEELARQAEAA